MTTTIAAALPLLADASIVPGVDTSAMTSLEKLMLLVILALSTVIGILFARLEKSRDRLYEDAKLDGAADRLTAAALKAIAEKLGATIPKEKDS